ncbi:chymotrypsin-2-like [Cylas formicarius]|uniref:chymotrypsin-2-like n=1 Tax=Cylas formicarius TaxID=197179 RepID=UPI002958551B|nr:chymotrypsin-2-like [Cylas formicarius]
MNQSFVILLLAVASCTAFVVDPRIVNGTDASEGEFPYVVSLRYNLSHVCGASILSDRFILTAAHCVYYIVPGVAADPYLFSIQYGSVSISATDERSVDVEKITIAAFDMEKQIYDVAVLKLVSPLPNDGLWEPVKLGRDFDASSQHSGVIVGWGRLWDNGRSPTVLQKLDVSTYTSAICGEYYNNSHHICLGASPGGACSGDSGTALVVDGAQVGIASFITSSCGVSGPNSPNVYSRVPFYYDWILENSAN